jgi:hypothetical protein
MTDKHQRHTHICIGCYYMLHSGCDYMDSGMTIKGWDAEYHQRTKTYGVKQCPNYISDKVRTAKRDLKSELTDVGYRKLAMAVVTASVKDYRGALYKLKTKGIRSWVIQDCERFFRSGWFYELTNMDGDRLINIIRKNVGVDTIDD